MMREKKKHTTSFFLLPPKKANKKIARSSCDQWLLKDVDLRHTHSQFVANHPAVRRTINCTMASTEATPRYRNFSNNMPSSIIQTPRAPSSSLITVEKEPERDPEVDCFMCRQAHVYVKPIGMHQERRVARRHPPPLTRAQIDELSRKKHLTKLEARKLLQCYFPEIKDVKYFQLHKYHSCCYDPKHLNLCKNHITALQREREEHPDHHHNGTSDNPYKDYEREGAQHNRVSFVRIKIEPTKGIPTRFLGPTVLPESLADMLIKQVNRLEDKKTKSSEPYNVRRVNNPNGSSEDDDENDDDEDDDSDDAGDNHQTTQRGKSTNGDLVVEDLDELNRLYINRQDAKDSDHNNQTFSKPLKKKKGKKKSHTHGHQNSKLKHWELMALEQSKQESCNCRHHVMRLEADKILYDWCRCKDHQHKEIVDRAKSVAVPPVPPPPPRPEEFVQPTPPKPKPRAKPRKVRRRSIGIDATEPTTTELALAYDPSAVDYDMIQEVIYYRTSSGRLIKPEISNAFTYDSMPPAMDIHRHEQGPNKAEVLYMTTNGQLKPFEAGTRLPGKKTDRSPAPKSITLSHPGSLYNGQAYVDLEHSSSNNATFGAMPVLKLPPSMTSSRQHSSGQSSHNHQPTEFTLAKFSPDKSVGTPSSRRSIASSTQGKSRPLPMTMQKSSKPTYSNLEPTPDYGRESSVVANRRWFDQPLGDQNLRSVHDGQYGLIAGASTDKYASKNEPSSENEYPESETPTNKNGSNCTIS